MPFLNSHTTDGTFISAVGRNFFCLKLVILTPE